MTNKSCASGLCKSNSRSHTNIKFAKFVQPGVDKGMFYSERAIEMSNRHIKVPKIVPGPSYPVRNIISSNIMII